MPYPMDPRPITAALNDLAIFAFHLMRACKAAKDTKCQRSFGRTRPGGYLPSCPINSLASLGLVKAFYLFAMLILINDERLRKQLLVIPPTVHRSSSRGGG